jgi:hypothetical protein
MASLQFENPLHNWDSQLLKKCWSATAYPQFCNRIFFSQHQQARTFLRHVAPQLRKKPNDKKDPTSKTECQKD